MSQIPAELRYASTHEWARLEDGIVTVGITDHAQNALGDVVYVELPELGDKLSAAEEAGVVESVKAASDVYAPVSGEVVAVNELLEESPEMINSDPYTEGWFYKIRLDDPEEFANLLDADEYRASLEDDE